MPTQDQVLGALDILRDALIARVDNPRALAPANAPRAPRALVQLAHGYTADVSGGAITVGCQQFEHSALDRLITASHWTRR